MWTGLLGFRERLVHVTQLNDLFEYNAWANALVVDEMDKLPDEARRAEMPELGGSALSLLEHTAQVEAAFHWLMTGVVRERTRDGSYEAVRSVLMANAELYRQDLPKLETRLQDQCEVPWFKRAFTIEQALTQVATHSVQHRAGICAGIARGGGTAPGLDYIMWLNQHR